MSDKLFSRRAAGLPVFIAAGTLTLSGMSVHAEEIPRPMVGYAATQTMTVGDFSMQSRIYQQDGKRRTETEMMGQQMYTIVRPDLQVIWTGMPGGMYMEMPFGEEAEMPGQQERVPGLEEMREALVFEAEGTEVISGHSTTRYHYIVEDPGTGEQIDGRAWLTDQNIPVQLLMTTEYEGRPAQIRMLLTDLQTGSQPDSLFEVAPGAQKFSMGGFPGFGGGGGGLFGGGRGRSGGDQPVQDSESSEPAEQESGGRFRRLRDALRN